LYFHQQNYHSTRDSPISQEKKRKSRSTRKTTHNEHTTQHFAVNTTKPFTAQIKTNTQSHNTKINFDTINLKTKSDTKQKPSTSKKKQLDSGSSIGLGTLVSNNDVQCR